MDGFRALPAVVFMLLRRLRVGRGMLLTLAVVVGLTALVGAAIPRFYNQILDAELRYRIASAPESQRNISMSLDERVSGSQESITQRMETKGAAYEAGLSPALQEIIREREFVIASPQLGMSDLTEATEVEFARSLQFRSQSAIERHIEVVEGRMPTRREPIRVAEVAGPGYEGEPDAVWPHFEVAVSVATARALGLAADDLVLIAFEGEEERAFAVLELVGLFEFVDAEEDYWYGDLQLSEPQVRSFGDLVVASGLLAPDAYSQLLEFTGTLDWHYLWRYFIDPEGFDVGNQDDLAAEIRQLQVTLGPSDELWPNPNRLTLTTGVPALLEGFESQAQFVLSIIGLAAIGIVVTALLAMVVLAATLVERRERLVVQIRSRGATSAQILCAQAVEGLLICAPAATAGYLGAAALVDARPTSWSLWFAGGVCALMISLLLLAASSSARAHLETLIGSHTRVVQRAPPEIVALELLVAVLAIAGLLALRRRGLAPASGTEATFDPYLAAVPLLLALASGILLLRIYPLPVRLLAALARRRRDAVFFLGTQLVAAQSRTARLPLLVMVLAVGISGFAGIVAHSVERAQHESAWQQAGADYRIEARGISLPADLDLDEVDGIEHTAVGVRLSDSLILPPEGAFATAGVEKPPVTVFALEAEKYEDVVAGSYLAGAVPGASDAPDGSSTSPIPAVLSAVWPEEAEPRPESGAVIRIELHTPQAGIQTIHVAVVARRKDFPGLDTQEPFVLIPLEDLRTALSSERVLRATTLFVSGAIGNVEELEAAIEMQSTSPASAAVIGGNGLTLDVFSRRDIQASLRAAPLAEGVITTFRTSIVLGALYAALAVVSSLALTAGARRRDMGYLRTLGLSTRQAMGLVAVEHIPPVLIASLVGSGLGIAIAQSVSPAVDLNVFTRQPLPVALSIDWLLLGLLAGTLAVIATLAIVTVSLTARQVHLGQVLRIDEA